MSMGNMAQKKGKKAGLFSSILVKASADSKKEKGGVLRVEKNLIFSGSLV